MSEVRPLKNTPSGGPNTRQQLEDAGLGMGKVPPQAVQLEEAVLGAMMLDKDCVNRVIDILRPESVPAGSVVFVSKNTLHLATGDGALAIEQLQPAGKKPMSVADFLNGQKLTGGQLLTAQAG